MPGDIIELHPDYTLPCDVLLLSGACLVDESLLSGEALPQLKTALPTKDSDMSQVQFPSTSKSDIDHIKNISWYRSYKTLVRSKLYFISLPLNHSHVFHVINLLTCQSNSKKKSTQ